MNSTERLDPARRRVQLRSAWALLARGRFQDAVFAFGRILREEPDHQEARRGREKASHQLAEARRQADQQLAEAEAARVSGDEDAARRLAEEALEVGADPERALGLLDRLPASPGALAEPRPVDRPADRPPFEGAPRLVWSRVGLVSFWVLAFGLIAAGVASSWEQIVGQLASAPRPELHR